MAVDSFYESLAVLDDSEGVVRVGTALLLRAATRPERTAPLPGLRIRVLRSRSHGGFPALRLFYWLDDHTTYLLSIEPYDELA